MKRKPDALLLLAAIFGLGLLVSSLTHGNRDESPAGEEVAAVSNDEVPATPERVNR